MTTPIERLRQLVETGDPAGTVTLGWLGKVLAEDPTERSQAPTRDLAVKDVAERTDRSPSTVRRWLERGEMRGYKINGRDWRVTPAAFEEWRQKQMEGPTPDVDPDEDVDIAEWRKSA